MTNEQTINNEIIATKVMGWILACGIYLQGGSGQGQIFAADLPDFLNDHNAALMVVEKMREDGWSVEIATNDAANNWNVKLHSADFTQVEENHGQSLCHEICRAALKAKGG